MASLAPLFHAGINYSLRHSLAKPDSCLLATFFPSAYIYSTLSFVCLFSSSTILCTFFLPAFSSPPLFIFIFYLSQSPYFVVSFTRSLSLLACRPIYPYIHPSIHPPTYPSVRPSVFPPTTLPIGLSAHLPAYLPT